MGLGIVLLFWAVVGTVVAGIGAVALGWAITLFSRNLMSSRRKAIVTASLFPFACLGWAAGVFVFQAIVNEGLLHSDVGLGDTWHAPLPNGYQIMMIDVTDQGWVYNLKTQPGSGVGEREDAVAGVRNVQVAGRYILGNTDSKAVEHLGKDSNGVNSYFILDTRTGRRAQFQDYTALRDRALELNIVRNLQPINTVYAK